MYDRCLWSNWFGEYPGSNYFLKVPNAYIEDEFNLTGLSKLVPNYRGALEVLLDAAAIEDAPIYYDDTDGCVVDDDESMSKSLSSSSLESHCSSSKRRRMTRRQYIGSRAGLSSSDSLLHAAVRLYGLIHARYVLNRQGLQQIANRVAKRFYGTCPRELCGESGLCPVGLYDTQDLAEMKVFCSRCSDVYEPPLYHTGLYIDGSYFTTTLPQLLYLTFPSLVVPLTTDTPSADFCRPRGHPPGTEMNLTTPLTSDTEQQPLYVVQSADASMQSHQMSSSHSQSSSSNSETDDESLHLSTYDIYEPRIFGFRLHPSSKFPSNAFWLRWQPGVEIPPSYVKD